MRDISPRLPITPTKSDERPYSSRIAGVTYEPLFPRLSWRDGCARLKTAPIILAKGGKRRSGEVTPLPLPSLPCGQLEAPVGAGEAHFFEASFAQKAVLSSPTCELDKC